MAGKVLGQRERLDKVLANHGFGTRKEVKHLIHFGRVTLNGSVCRDDAVHVNLETDEICVDGKALEVKLNAYIMMNKPAGYVCASKDGLHETVFSLLGEELNRNYLGGSLQLVGRLDIDTEGLLIFTSDGALNHYITSPQNKIPKTYFVRLKDKILPGNEEGQQDDYVKKLSLGMHIEAEGNEGEADCLPAHLEWKTQDEACLTVYEGKYHEVKRLFKALGNEVIYLKRLKINGLTLDESLPKGSWRELTSEEYALLLDKKI